jgi:hypothetical protein
MLEYWQGVLSYYWLPLLSRAYKRCLDMKQNVLPWKKGVDISETPHVSLYEVSCWQRVQSLPSILTGGRFQLARNNHYVKCLDKLIKIRNKLLHINDGISHLIGPSDLVKIEGDIGTVKVRIPEYAWGSVTLSMVESFRAAVDAYFREVLFRKPEDIKQGTILTPASRA